MIRRPPRSTRTDTRFPYTTLFRSPLMTPFDDFRIGFERYAPRRANETSAPVTDVSALRRNIAFSAMERHRRGRSEEHTSELQSLMRISYAVFCLKKKKQTNNNT